MLGGSHWGATSLRQTWLVSCPCLYETFAQVSKGLCPGEVSPPLSSFTLSELPWWDPGYTNYLKMIWGTGQERVGAEFSFQTWNEIWYLCCWVWSTKEPVSVVDAPKSPVVSKYPAPLTNTASFLPAFYGLKGTVWLQGQRLQLTFCVGLEAMFYCIWKLMGKYFTLLESLTWPRNTFSMLDHSTPETFSKSEKERNYVA